MGRANDGGQLIYFETGLIGTLSVLCVSTAGELESCRPDSLNTINGSGAKQYALSLEVSQNIPGGMGCLTYKRRFPFSDRLWMELYSIHLTASMNVAVSLWFNIAWGLIELP